MYLYVWVYLCLAPDIRFKVHLSGAGPSGSVSRVAGEMMAVAEVSVGEVKFLGQQLYVTPSFLRFRKSLYQGEGSATPITHPPLSVAVDTVRTLPPNQRTICSFELDVYFITVKPIPCDFPLFYSCSRASESYWTFMY